VEIIRPVGKGEMGCCNGEEKENGGVGAVRSFVKASPACGAGGKGKSGSISFLVEEKGKGSRDPPVA